MPSRKLVSSIAVGGAANVAAVPTGSSPRPPAAAQQLPPGQPLPAAASPAGKGRRCWIQRSVRTGRRLSGQHAQQRVHRTLHNADISKPVLPGFDDAFAPG
jgi:hypothetical protein